MPHLYRYPPRFVTTRLAIGLATLVSIALVVGTVYLGYSDKDAIPASACYAPATMAANSEHTQGVEPQSPDGIRPAANPNNLFDTNCMLRGRYRAASQVADTEAPGGFAASQNAARKVSASNSARGLYLFAEPDVVTQCGKRPGMRICLI